MKRIITSLILLCLTTFMFASSDPIDKEKAIEEYRLYYASHPYRLFKLKPDISPQESLILLQKDGKFSDLIKRQEVIEETQSYLRKHTASQKEISTVNKIAYDRLWSIAEGYRGKKINIKDKTIKKLMKAYINYGELEAKRAPVSSGRFHESCFAIPSAAVNTYFVFYDLMEAVENNEEKSELAVHFNVILKNMGMQSWTQPFRLDETDENVVQVERFRKHVWWVGGNGLTFRPVLQASFMMRSVPMVDVIAEVCVKAMSNVSQNTFDEAFWTEGFTADGAGWGHGMQCLIWGYPILGTNSALSSLSILKGSPWAQQLDTNNIDALFNFFRGSSWYYYKGYELPCLGRGSMKYTPNPKKILTSNLLNTVKKDWINSLSLAQRNELEQFLADAEVNEIQMKGYPEGMYTGSRWFFNNDNFAHKTNDHHAYVSMASYRVDGIESATFADSYNFYTCDGMTLFQRSGDEYNQAKGAWNLTAVPGVTARQGEEKLSPITNWNGFCSKYNFAAAATSGGENAAVGFKFEKINGNSKIGRTHTEAATSLNDNEIIFGVEAHKAYFFIDNYALALGAGITNKRSDAQGDVWTTIDQTLWQGNIKYHSSKEDGTIKLGNDSETIELLPIHHNGAKLINVQQKGGFSYAVLPEYTTGSVHLVAENRKTKWNKINAANKKIKNKTTDVNIFQLWINHGQQAKEAQYAYVTYLGKNKAKTSMTTRPVSILRNDTLIQAASSLNSETIGAVFYDKNETLTADNYSISVSAPSVVMFEMSAGQCVLSVTDAEMNNELRSIVISTTLPVKGDNVSHKNGLNLITVDLPQGKLSGKPAVVILNL